LERGGGGGGGGGGKWSWDAFGEKRGSGFARKSERKGCAGFSEKSGGRDERQPFNIKKKGRGPGVAENGGQLHTAKRGRKQGVHERIWANPSTRWARQNRGRKIRNPGEEKGCYLGPKVEKINSRKGEFYTKETKANGGGRWK